jgi:hypothetical protein
MSYAILEYKKFIQSKFNLTYFEKNKNNQEFVKLLYAQFFHYPKIEFKDLSLPLLQKNTINEFYNLALHFRFGYKIDWNAFLKKCDKHSYIVYKEILTNPLPISKKWDLLYYNIRQFNNYNVPVIEGTIIEEHIKGQKIAIVKYYDDIFCVTPNYKYFLTQEIKNVLQKVPEDSFVLYGFYDKKHNKISLYDIERPDINQIERFKIIAKFYYNFEKETKKVFVLPNHQRKDYTFDKDKIYLLKIESKSMYLNKVNPLISIKQT